MYKIIFSDLDGTLRNSNREVSQRTKDDIQKLMNMGIEVILCSGRPRCELERISRECNASRYIISSNGAEVYDCITKKVLYRDLINIQAIVQAYEIAQKEDCTFVMHSGNVRIVNRYKYKDETEVIPKEGIISAAYNNNVIQCTIINKDFDKMKRVRRAIAKIPSIKIANESKCFKDKTIIPNDSIYCDLVDEETSKGIAIKTICELLGVDKKETIGIGDSYNDIELLKNVGYSVAMGNSVEKLQNKAKEVTDTNDFDGAAKFFEKIINGKM